MRVHAELLASRARFNSAPPFSDYVTTAQGFMEPITAMSNSTVTFNKNFNLTWVLTGKVGRDDQRAIFANAASILMNGESIVISNGGVEDKGHFKIFAEGDGAVVQLGKKGVTKQVTVASTAELIAMTPKATTKVEGDTIDLNGLVDAVGTASFDGNIVNISGSKVNTSASATFTVNADTKATIAATPTLKGPTNTFTGGEFVFKNGLSITNGNTQIKNSSTAIKNGLEVTGGSAILTADNLINAGYVDIRDTSKAITFNGIDLTKGAGDMACSGTNCGKLNIHDLNQTSKEAIALGAVTAKNITMTNNGATRAIGMTSGTTETINLNNAGAVSVTGALHTTSKAAATSTNTIAGTTTLTANSIQLDGGATVSNGANVTSTTSLTTQALSIDKAKVSAATGTFNGAVTVTGDSAGTTPTTAADSNLNISGTTTFENTVTANQKARINVGGNTDEVTFKNAVTSDNSAHIQVDGVTNLEADAAALSLDHAGTINLTKLKATDGKSKIGGGISSQGGSALTIGRDGDANLTVGGSVVVDASKVDIQGGGDTTFKETVALTNAQDTTDPQAKGLSLGGNAIFEKTVTATNSKLSVAKDSTFKENSTISGGTYTTTNATVEKGTLDIKDGAAATVTGTLSGAGEVLVQGQDTAGTKATSLNVSGNASVSKITAKDGAGVTLSGEETSSELVAEGKAADKIGEITVTNGEIKGDATINAHGKINIAPAASDKTVKVSGTTTVNGGELATSGEGTTNLAGQVTQTAGTTNLNGTTNITGTTQINGGAVHVGTTGADGKTVSVGANGQFNTAAAATATINNMNVNGGTSTFAGTNTIATGGKLSATGQGSAVNLTGATTFTDGSTVEAEQNSVINVTNVAGGQIGSQLNTATAGTINLGTSDLALNQAVTIAHAPKIEGTLAIHNAQKTTLADTAGITVANGATLSNAGAGALEVAGPTQVNEGTIVTTGTGVADFKGKVTTTANSTVTLGEGGGNFAGGLDATDTTINNTGKTTLGAASEIKGGTMTAAGIDVGGNTLTLKEGVNATVTGAIEGENGKVDVQGDTTVHLQGNLSVTDISAQAGSTIELDGATAERTISSNLTATGDEAQNKRGVINVRNGELSGQNKINPKGEINFAPAEGKTVGLATKGSITNAGGVLSTGGDGTTTLAGTITQTGANAATNLNGTTQITGSTSIDAGTLSLGTAPTQGDPATPGHAVTVAQGATLATQKAATTTVNNADIQGTATLEGQTNVEGSLSTSGQGQLTAGTVHVKPKANLTTKDTSSASMKNLQVDGTVTTQNESTLAVEEQATITGTLDAQGSSTATLKDSTVAATGKVKATGGTVNSKGKMNLSAEGGEVEATAGGSVNISAVDGNTIASQLTTKTQGTINLGKPAEGDQPEHDLGQAITISKAPQIEGGTLAVHNSQATTFTGDVTVSKDKDNHAGKLDMTGGGSATFSGALTANEGTTVSTSGDTSVQGATTLSNAKATLGKDGGTNAFTGKMTVSGDDANVSLNGNSALTAGGDFTGGTTNATGSVTANEKLDITKAKDNTKGTIVNFKGDVTANQGISAKGEGTVATVDGALNVKKGTTMADNGKIIAKGDVTTDTLTVGNKDANTRDTATLEVTGKDKTLSVTGETNIVKGAGVVSNAATNTFGGAVNVSGEDSTLTIKKAKGATEADPAPTTSFQGVTATDHAHVQTEGPTTVGGVLTANTKGVIDIGETSATKGLVTDDGTIHVRNPNKDNHNGNIDVDGVITATGGLITVEPMPADNGKAGTTHVTGAITSQDKSAGQGTEKVDGVVSLGGNVTADSTVAATHGGEVNLGTSATDKVSIAGKATVGGDDASTHAGSALNLKGETTLTSGIDVQNGTATADAAVTSHGDINLQTNGKANFNQGLTATPAKAGDAAPNVTVSGAGADMQVQGDAMNLAGNTTVSDGANLTSTARQNTLGGNTTANGGTLTAKDGPTTVGGTLAATAKNGTPGKIDLGTVSFDQHKTPKPDQSISASGQGSAVNIASVNQDDDHNKINGGISTQNQGTVNIGGFGEDGTPSAQGSGSLELTGGISANTGTVNVNVGAGNTLKAGAALAAATGTEANPSNINVTGNVDVPSLSAIGKGNNVNVTGNAKLDGSAQPEGKAIDAQAGGTVHVSGTGDVTGTISSTGDGTNVTIDGKTDIKVADDSTKSIDATNKGVVSVGGGGTIGGEVAAEGGTVNIVKPVTEAGKPAPVTTLNKITAKDSGTDPDKAEGVVNVGGSATLKQAAATQGGEINLGTDANDKITATETVSADGQDSVVNVNGDAEVNDVTASDAGVVNLKGDQNLVTGTLTGNAGTINAGAATTFGQDGGVSVTNNGTVNIDDVAAVGSNPAQIGSKGLVTDGPGTINVGKANQPLSGPVSINGPVTGEGGYINIHNGNHEVTFTNDIEAKNKGTDHHGIVTVDGPAKTTGNVSAKNDGSKVVINGPFKAETVEGASPLPTVSATDKGVIEIHNNAKDPNVFDQEVKADSEGVVSVTGPTDVNKNLTADHAGKISMTDGTINVGSLGGDTNPELVTQNGGSIEIGSLDKPNSSPVYINASKIESAGDKSTITIASTGDDSSLNVGKDGVKAHDKGVININLTGKNVNVSGVFSDQPDGVLNLNLGQKDSPANFTPIGKSDITQLGGSMTINPTQGGESTPITISKVEPNSSIVFAAPKADVQPTSPIIFGTLGDGVKFTLPAETDPAKSPNVWFKDKPAESLFTVGDGLMIDFEQVTGPDGKTYWKVKVSDMPKLAGAMSVVLTGMLQGAYATLTQPTSIMGRRDEARGAWVEVGHDQFTLNTAAQSKVKLDHIKAGYDQPVLVGDKNLIVGAMVDAQHHQSTMPVADAKAKGTLLKVGAYAVMPVADNVYVGVQANYLTMNSDLSSNLLNGKHRFNAYQAAAEVGAKIPMGAVTVEPDAQLTATFIKSGSLEVSKPGDKVAYGFDLANTKSLISRVGVKVSAPLPVAGMQAWTRVDAYHEFAGTQHVTAYHRGNKTQPGFEIANRGSWLTAQVGVDANLGPVKASASVGTSVDKRRNGFSANVGVKYAF